MARNLDSDFRAELNWILTGPRPLAVVPTAHAKVVAIQIQVSDVNAGNAESVSPIEVAGR